MTATAYRVLRPGAGVVSRHRTLSGAIASLRRQRRGAVKQGGYSLDEVEVRMPDGWWRRLTFDELDAREVRA
jgi:hypothetical protein